MNNLVGVLRAFLEEKKVQTTVMFTFITFLIFFALISEGESTA